MLPSLRLLALIFGRRNLCHRVLITCSQSEFVFRFLIGCHQSQIKRLDFAVFSKCTCAQGHLKLAWSLNRIMRTEKRLLTRNVGKKKLPSCKVIFFSNLGPIPSLIFTPAPCPLALGHKGSRFKSYSTKWDTPSSTISFSRHAAFSPEIQSAVLLLLPNVNI